MKNNPWTYNSADAVAYQRDNEHFCEPLWVSERLFEEEEFKGGIYDPACGFGNIVISAMRLGLRSYGSDLVFRGWDSTPQDFLLHHDRHDNFVTNPPFDIIREFTEHALSLARRKVAIIIPTSRLNAAHWLRKAPLRRIWLLTPRPSMPPGHVIKDGGKITGGKTDYAWAVMEKGYKGEPEIKWLHRDTDDTLESKDHDTARA